MADVEILKSHHRTRAGDSEMQVNIGGVNEDLTAHLIGLEKQVEWAVNSAIKKVARWLRTHSVREIGRELNITQAVLKRRYRFSDVGKGFNRKVNIWVGLLAIAAHEAGKASKNPAGVKVRGRQFDGAFLQRIYGSEEKVYIRASANRKYGHTTTTEGGRDWARYSRPKLNSVRAEYGDRFPVQVVGIDIEEPALEVLQRFESRLNSEYTRILGQELNYAIHVKEWN